MRHRPAEPGRGSVAGAGCSSAWWLQLRSSWVPLAALSGLVVVHLGDIGGTRGAAGTHRRQDRAPRNPKKAAAGGDARARRRAGRLDLGWRTRVPRSAVQVEEGIVTLEEVLGDAGLLADGAGFLQGALDFVPEAAGDRRLRDHGIQQCPVVRHGAFRFGVLLLHAH